MMKSIVLFTQFDRDHSEFNSEKIYESKKVLFFDMDGTLIFSDFANYLAYKEAYEHILRRELELKFVPTERLDRKTLKAYNPEITDSQLMKITQFKEKCYSQYLLKNELNMELVNLLDSVYGKNKIFLVTNGRKDRVNMTLNHFRLKNFFTGILTKDDTEGAGEINKYKVALSKWNLSPETVVAYENEDVEIENAKSTGILDNNIIRINNYGHIYNFGKSVSKSRYSRL